MRTQPTNWKISHFDVTIFLCKTVLWYKVPYIKISLILKITLKPHRSLFQLHSLTNPSIKDIIRFLKEPLISEKGLKIESSWGCEGGTVLFSLKIEFEDSHDTRIAGCKYFYTSGLRVVCSNTLLLSLNRRSLRLRKQASTIHGVERYLPHITEIMLVRDVVVSLRPLLA